MAKPYSSVIICTYNRAQSLKRTIQSLANQSLSSDDFEIIVIDDGSSDSTLELCNEMQKDIPNLNVISTLKKMALGSVRNIGAQHSKGDSLFFTDDDCIADKYWVETMSVATQKHPIVAGAVDSNKELFFQLCRLIMITEMRAVKQVDILLASRLIKSRPALVKMSILLQSQ